MNQEEGDGRKPQDGKPNKQSMLVYALVGVLGAALLVMLYMQGSDIEISYQRLLELIEVSDEDGPGQIEFEQQRDGESARVHLSDLQEVKIGDREVRGQVDVYRPDLPESDTNPQKQASFKCHRGTSDAVEAQLEDMLRASDVSWSYEQKPSAWQAYMPMLVFTGVLVLFFVLMMRRLGGAGSPMQFGRSRGKLYALEDLGVTFDDAAGIDEAVEEVRELVDFLRLPDKYHQLGGRIPKGVLLVGPPGTGKTLLAKAIAGEAGVPFFSLSGSDFVEMFVGVGAARVRDMFQQAEAKAPCIIFIDELDALGKTRGTNIVGGHDEREQTLNALLVQMDGFDSNSGVIVMGASNRPETLDQALLRPGRFDRQVLVDRPDVRGREEILRVHVKNVKLADDVDLASVASISPGFAGADLANLVNEAALLAARGNKNAAGMDEFNEAVERVTAGLEKKQRIMSEDEKQRVAYHESAHALVAYSLPNTDAVHKVSIIPRGFAALGYTMQRPEEDRFLMTQPELENHIQVLLAGTIAEELVYTDISTGAQNDLNRATAIARSMVTEYGMSRMGRIYYRGGQRSAFLNMPSTDNQSDGYSESTACKIDEEVRRIIEEAIEKVRHIVESRRPALEALTRRLIDVESIAAKELQEIVDAHSPGPQVVPGTGETKRDSSSTEASEPTVDPHQKQSG